MLLMMRHHNGHAPCLDAKLRRAVAEGDVLPEAGMAVVGAVESVVTKPWRGIIGVGYLHGLQCFTADKCKTHTASANPLYGAINARDDPVVPLHEVHPRREQRRAIP